jgi:hypothetical protein
MFETLHSFYFNLIKSIIFEKSLSANLVRIFCEKYFNFILSFTIAICSLFVVIFEKSLSFKKKALFDTKVTEQYQFQIILFARGSVSFFLQCKSEMNSTDSQLKRKRSIDCESEDSVSVKKQLRHRKLFVPAKFSSKIKYCKANNRYYLDSIFTPEQIYRIFPHLKISVQKGNPNILVQQHLAYVKATGIEEEKIKFCVHPPKGVSEIDWVCFLGPFCPFFFVGAGALSAEELKSCIPPKKLTYQDLNNFFLPYLFEKSTTRNSNILKQVDFLCLLPVEDSDLNRLKEFLGDSVQKERFFACPCHFKSRVKTGSEVRVNKAEGLQLVFD